MASSPRTPDRRPRHPKDAEEGRPLKPGSPGGAPPTAGGSDKRLLWFILLVLLLAAGGYAYAHRVPAKRELGAPDKPPSAAVAAPDEGRVSVDGTSFSLHCRPFIVAGFNGHDLAPKAIATVEVNKCAGGKPGRAWVREQFKNVTAAGLNVVRVYAHTTDPKLPHLTGPDTVNEDNMLGLDIVLDEARRARLKVILSLLDNWKFKGGVDEIVEMSATAPPRAHKRPFDGDGDFDDTGLPDDVKKYEVTRHALFFSDAGSRDIYKRWATTVLTRRNAFNGRVYADDPTIMAVNLLNEPRCETWAVPECAETFGAWVADAAAHVKSVAPDVLVTIGSEGFYAGDDKERVARNPQEWGSMIGQNFMSDGAIPNVDFLTVHYWPDNWFLASETEFMHAWIDGHAADAAALGKPIILQEFGKTLPKPKNAAAWTRAVRETRDLAFKAVYAHVADHVARAESALAGALFWRLELPVYAGSSNADYGVAWADATTVDIVTKYAKKAGALAAATPPDARCRLECWTPVKGGGRACVEDRAACSVAAADDERRVYPNKATCCLPGLGAFEKGCVKGAPAHDEPAAAAAKKKGAPWRSTPKPTPHDPADDMYEP